MLLADRPTTGGYAKVATVISADLRIFAQLAPGDTVAFRATTAEEAIKALREQEAILGSLRRAVHS